MRYACLDLGTNSFLCLVGEVLENRWRILEDVSQVVRLGQEVDKTGRFHPEALGRAEIALRHFDEICRKWQVDQRRVVSTSAARDVENSDELIEIGRRWGFEIEVIAGAREAALTSEGATSGLDLAGDILVVDVGGGSTELIVRDESKEIEKLVSLDLGCVRLTERHFSAQPVPRSELDQVRELLLREFSCLREWGLHQRPITMLAVGGTPSTLAALKGGGFDARTLHGSGILLRELSQRIDELAAMSVDERVAELKLDRGRADVLPMGALILEQCLKQLEADRLVVSVRGVRFGLAQEFNGQAEEAMN